MSVRANFTKPITQPLPVNITTKYKKPDIIVLTNFFQRKILDEYNQQAVVTILDKEKQTTKQILEKIYINRSTIDEYEQVITTKNESPINSELTNGGQAKIVKNISLLTMQENSASIPERKENDDEVTRAAARAYIKRICDEAERNNKAQFPETEVEESTSLPNWTEETTRSAVQNELNVTTQILWKAGDKINNIDENIQTAIEKGTPFTNEQIQGFDQEKGELNRIKIIAENRLARTELGMDALKTDDWW